MDISMKGVRLRRMVILIQVQKQKSPAKEAARRRVLAFV